MNQNDTVGSKETKNKAIVRGVPGNGRIGALSDGVFAIVITLLVLEIKVPTVEAIDLPSALYETVPKILSHIVSFIVLGIYWIGHHNMFEHIKRHDRVLLWLNIIFLLCVASMAFPTGLIVQYPEQQVAVIIYAVTLIAGGVVLDLMWWYASKDRRLVIDTMQKSFINSVHRRILIAPILYTLAILFSFINVLLSYLIIVAVIVYYIVPLEFDSFHHIHIRKLADDE